MSDIDQHSYIFVTFILIVFLSLLISCSDQGEKPTEPDVTTPMISIGDMTVAEGGTVLFNVSLSFAATNIVSFNYTTSNQSATAGLDYTAISGTDTIQIGAQSTTILVSTNNDTDIENIETFLLTLSSAVNAQLFDSVAQGSILDDTTIPLMSVSDMTVTEGGDVLFNVNLSFAATKLISFNYTTSDQSAKAASDYSAVSGTDSIPIGSQSTIVIVSTTDDNDPEITETFLLTLSSAVNAQLFDSVALGSITDNDIVSFATDIQPILRVECAKLGICHGAMPGGGQLYMGTAATYLLVRNGSGQNGLIIVPDSSLRSSLYTVLTDFPFPASRMPKDGPPYLTLTEQQLFKDWIDQGALDN